MVFDNRTSSSDCDGSRRDAARLEQDALIALRQRNLRGRCPGLAAEALKVGGEREARPRQSNAPMTRNMCGRSFGNRPYALVRLFGSRPNVTAVGNAPATVLTCASAAAEALDACSP